MDKIALIAALQFICTEYRLDEKGSTEAEPELFRVREEPIMQRQSGGGDEQQGVCMPQVAVRSPK